ncbi:MAG TPA: GtrA family protein [Ktedonobacterales bacterium]|nr:GtrA family protein [Ktedonobacterales bacterium]
MANPISQTEEVDVSEPPKQRGTTQPMTVVRPADESRSRVVPLRPTYHPTRIAVVNRVLDVVDERTQGRAGMVQRLFSYLFIGGCAALINLAMLKLMLTVLQKSSVDEHLQFIIASAVAYEVSIFANFVPNDYFTFRHLPGHARTWLARAARFHLTSIGGIIVTFTIAATVHYVFKVEAFWAQAIALLLAVVFNFTFHHIFTYRALRKHHAPEQSASHFPR